MEQLEKDVKDTIVMKLLHYFITEKNYNPVILQGAKNEIWLENMKENYKIVRIVSEYIHNDEQLDFKVAYTSALNGTSSLNSDLSTQEKTFKHVLDLIINLIKLFDFI